MVQERFPFHEKNLVNEWNNIYAQFFENSFPVVSDPIDYSPEISNIFGRMVLFPEAQHFREVVKISVPFVPRL